jgi:hypothetical protein
MQQLQQLELQTPSCADHVPLVELYECQVDLQRRAEEVELIGKPDSHRMPLRSLALATAELNKMVVKTGTTEGHTSRQNPGRVS